VIAVDTNVLVYAHRVDAALHVAAEAAIRELAEDRAAWAIPWPCVHEFFAIVTHPRIYNPPTSGPRAVEQIEAWFASPSLALLNEGPAHWSTLSGLIGSGRLAGPQIHDARIAAICLQHGIRELWTADRDFTRFTRLRVRNPLIDPSR